MPYLRISVLLVFAVVASGKEAPRSPVARAAAAFLETLDKKQRALTVAPFDSPDRESWNYVPMRREGIPLSALDARQKVALHLLFNAALTPSGQKKLKGVLTLEGVLVEYGADPAFRDVGAYHTRIFGDPKSGKPWGFSFEGHHISLNYTSQKGLELAGTPTFFGANPHLVPRGKHKGLRILGAEEDAARALLASLSAKQRERAVIRDAAPREIVTGARSRVRLENYAGIPAKELAPAQRKQLRTLVELYARNHRPAIADGFLKRIDAAGFDKVHFAWAGSALPRRPHYFRIHGPSFVIEYVNVQNGANHSHTVVRDFKHDFGRDWLADHLRNGHGK